MGGRVRGRARGERVRGRESGRGREEREGYGRRRVYYTIQGTYPQSQFFLMPPLSWDIIHTSIAKKKYMYMYM